MCLSCRFLTPEKTFLYNYCYRRYSHYSMSNSIIYVKGVPHLKGRWAQRL